MNKFGVAKKTKEDARAQDLLTIKEFMDGLPVDAVMNAVIESMRDRDDYDPEMLTRMSNELGRIAWKKLPA